MRTDIKRIVLCAICSAVFTFPVRAADVISATAPTVEPVVSDGWTFSITPYFWAAGLSGDTSASGVPVVISIDADFSDILENLDFAAMAIVDARNGRYSIFGDLIYTKLGASRDTPLGIFADSADVEASTFAGLVGAGYSVLEGPSGHLDIVGGIRVWSVDTDLSFSGLVLDGRSFSDGATWVDGLVGIRGNYSFTPQFYFTGWALVGAGEADIDWDVAGGLGYRINERFSATVGYRALGVDYSNDEGFLFDAVQQGPILGLTVRF
jgi:hypothetical protein